MRPRICRISLAWSQMALLSEKGRGLFVACNASMTHPLTIQREPWRPLWTASTPAPVQALVPSSRRMSRTSAVASNRAATSLGSLPPGPEPVVVVRPNKPLFLRVESRRRDYPVGAVVIPDARRR